MLSDKASSGLGAVVLAAGESSRMGSSKAALEWQERSFLGHCLALAASVLSPRSPLFVIEGAHPLDDLLHSVNQAVDQSDSPASPTKKLVHTGWRDGPLSSLQCALREPELRGLACLVLTVDRPHLAYSTLRALVEAHAAQPESIWQPSYRGAHGHPIIWPADLVMELAALQPSSSPRELLGQQKIAGRRAFVKVDDPAVCDNIDDPIALETLRRLTR